MECDAVATDSAFSSLRAHRYIFESGDESVDENDEWIDHVRRAFKDKDYVNLMVCTSPSNGSQVFYPLCRIKDKDGDVTDVKLIKGE